MASSTLLGGLLTIYVVLKLCLSADVEVWKQCGGYRSPCQRNEHCSDHHCPSGSSCRFYNQNFWRCQPDSMGSTVGVWGECGGLNSPCRSNSPCRDLPCSQGNRCNFYNKDFWQCQPGDVGYTVALWGECGGTYSSCQTNGPCSQHLCVFGAVCNWVSDTFWRCEPGGQPSRETPSGSDEFVKTRGTQLYWHGRPFYFVGANAYWIMDPFQNNGFASEARVEEFLKTCQSRGINVLRTWAFSDNFPNYQGGYDPRIIKRLDFVIATAARYGVKLQLALGNYWQHYKAPEEYVARVFGGARGRSIKDFYGNQRVRELYFSHIQFVVTRINSITNIPYNRDPTIMSWSVINEPRYPGGHSSSDLNLMIDFIGAAADLIKRLAPDHLVAADTEGFFSPADGDLRYYNPGPGGQCEGAGWIELGRLRNIDMTTLHIYPDFMELLPNPDRNNPNWITCDDSCQLNWLQQWLDAHMKATREQINKPMVVQEFGINQHWQGMEQRKRYMRVVLDMLVNSARQNDAYAGAMWWNAAMTGFPDHDGTNLVIDTRQSNELRVSNLVVDPDGFRYKQQRNECGRQAAAAGWRPGFRVINVVDTTRLTREVSGTTDLRILEDAVRSLHNLQGR